MVRNTDTSLSALVGLYADRLKAFFIVMVAADHNDWFRQLSPNLFEPLTFHVLGFFFLAFTFGRKNWSLRFIGDRVARYLVPYWWALTAASSAYFLMFSGSTSSSDNLFALMLAAIIGNAPFVKSAAGLLMLWFLPSLFGLTCLLALFNSLQMRFSKHFAIGLAIVMHLVIPVLPSSSMLWLPFGLAIVTDIFVLGLIWQQLLIVKMPNYWGPIAAAVFVGSYGALVSVPVHLEIATLQLAGIDRPLVLLLQDISGLSGVLTAVWLVGLPCRVIWFENIGKNSLLVYLIHPVVYVVLGKIFPLAPKETLEPLVLFFYGCFTTGIALGVAYGMSVLLSRSEFFAKWITPKSWSQWPPVVFFAEGR